MDGGWLVLIGMVVMLGGGSWALRRLADRRRRLAEQTVRSIAADLGLGLGLADTGVLGGMRGRIDDVTVQVTVPFGGHLPQIVVSAPGVPNDLEIPKRGPLPPWAQRLDGTDRAVLERWRGAHAFEVRRGCFVLNWWGGYEEIPTRARELVRLIQGIRLIQGTGRAL